jgi:hypothetical protein
MTTRLPHVLRGWLLCALCFFCADSHAIETNQWIKPASGKWEEQTAWSLGILPGPGQSISITNEGAKSVEADAATAQNFPASLFVDQITINGQNTLLLNRVGTNALREIVVGTGLSNTVAVVDGGAVVNFESALITRGVLRIGGGNVFQDGGVTEAAGAALLYGGGTYHLTNGFFQSGAVDLPSSGAFHQYGGRTSTRTLSLTDSTYNLHGGDVIVEETLRVTDLGRFTQDGGTNRASDLYVVVASASSANYALNGGALYTSNVVVQALLASSAIRQTGGVHVISDTLWLRGSARFPRTPIPATYTVGTDAFLSARSVVIDESGGFSYLETSGTTRVAESIRFAGSPEFVGALVISGGMLTCSNVLNEGAAVDIRQTGGAFVVTNLLSFSGFYPGIFGQNGRPARYEFMDGTLAAGNIELAAEWIIGSSAQPGRVTNPGDFKMAGILRAGDANEHLGRFILTGNATIDLGDGKSKLSFGKSGDEGWNTSATLAVTNWSGSTAGSGEDRLKFGDDQSGLTPAQLGQVRFVNPAGFAPGVYPTRILDDGEVVPAPRPSVALAVLGRDAVLRWEGDFFLQSSTNVVGPYVDLAGATSPYTNDVRSSPQQFFRLRR